MDKRVERGMALAGQCEVLGAVSSHPWVIVSGSVPSSNGGHYHVSVAVRDGLLVEGACECPDDGVVIRGRHQCKHRIALAMHWNAGVLLVHLLAQLLGWEWIEEFGGGEWVFYQECPPLMREWLSQ